MIIICIYVYIYIYIFINRERGRERERKKDRNNYRTPEGQRKLMEENKNNTATMAAAQANQGNQLGRIELLLASLAGGVPPSA